MKNLRYLNPTKPQRKLLQRLAEGKWIEVVGYGPFNLYFRCYLLDGDKVDPRTVNSCIGNWWAERKIVDGFSRVVITDKGLAVIQAVPA